MNLKHAVLSAAVLLPTVASVPAHAAETLSGAWDGHMVTAKGKIPSNAAYNWKTGKGWNFAPIPGAASWFVVLEISGPFKSLEGTYFAKDKANAKSWGKYEFDGNFNFAKKLMVWTPGTILEGPNKLANTVIRSLTYSRDDDHEYLKGRWASQDGNTGVMEFRRDYDGTELKEQTETVSDYVIPEDGEYTIKKDDWFLTLNDAKDAVLSKKDAGEDKRKWKFEKAPDQFPKAFRIVPVSDDGKCLVPRDDDTGELILKDKEDTPEGEQYWRLEKNGDGVMIVNEKLGGRALYINDEDNGDTIIRSRNEAHSNKWMLEKQ